MWYVMLLYLLASCVSGLILWDEGCFLVFSWCILHPDLAGAVDYACSLSNCTTLGYGSCNDFSGLAILQIMIHDPSESFAQGFTQIQEESICLIHLTSL
ncbi:hypothetical protein MTR_5g009480 [Medicago truncatula]|uniref:Transmembrane protein n=1 Tax=Medicago truncatula TaxID=3880 RepID=G7KAM3_MEDTR|nr:hypothetical protein MTR_5g009480 [Medicago truncatula]